MWGGCDILSGYRNGTLGKHGLIEILTLQNSNIRNEPMKISYGDKI